MTLSSRALPAAGAAGPAEDRPAGAADSPPLLSRTAPSLPSRLAPTVLILAAWQAASLAAASPLLPAPLAVLSALEAETLHGPLLRHLGATLLRVGGCFTLAMLLGSALGIGMGLSARLDRWLAPWLQTLLNLPAMVIAILAYVWLGLDETAAVVAITLSKLPNVAVILRQGTRQRDRRLAEMAQCFHFSRRARLFHLLLPELGPYFLAATRTGLSLVWKIVLLVELLGRSNGIGFQLHLLFQMMDITRILAYAASFMLVIQGVELSLLAWGERHVHRWRP